MTAAIQERSDVPVSVGSPPQAGGYPTVLARRFACRPSSIGAARRAVEELGASLQQTVLADLRLLVSELVANSVEHGPRRDGRTIRLRVSIGEERVRAEVEDDGCGFIPMACLPPAEAPSGRGLYFVEELAAAWGVTSAGGTCVWFELDRERFEA